MSQNPPPLPLPDSSPDCEMDTNFLDGTFDTMLLNPQIVSPDDFDKDLSAAKAEDTLAAPGVDVARLKECIVFASASVWGVPTMRPTQLEVCYCLLHPHHLNHLIVVHQMGGGRDTHTPISRCY